jgi:dihydroorotase
MTQIELQSPLDMHIHFREGAMLNCVAPLSAETFAGGVIMPNLMPPVDSLQRLFNYETAVKAAITPHTFAPYMTLFFRDYSAAELVAAHPHIIGIKLYPAGITTNSTDGVRSLHDAETTIRLMAELGIPLLVHGETNGFVMDREVEFLDVYMHLAASFPQLKIVMEHITTQKAVALLDKFENLFATVTLQHLLITLDDVAGDLLNPHLFCKPIAKRPEDRAALLSAALNAHPKLSFGSDSAPHPIHKKEAAGCAAGVFTAPVALQMLAALFDKHQALNKLQAFVSDNAQRIYAVTPPHKRVLMENSAYIVPEKYGDVVPIMAGQTIPWRIVQVSV